MKQYRRIFALAVVLLMLTAFPGAALAADAEGAEPTQETPPAVPLYPAEVRTSEENGMIRLERIYYLSTRDDPAAIPTDDFDREGLHYTLLDILKNDLSETDTKDYIEVITLESSTKDLGEIIKTLEPELEVVTEDGYTGILKPDYANISVEAADYRTSSWTVSATRTYPNLSDADIALIPKTTEDSGRTLTLADVDWQEASTDYVDGAALAVRYTAVATYTGTATSRYASGYTVTVDYSGEVTKTSIDTIIYTAIFSAENVSQRETRFENEGAAAEDNEAQRDLPEATEAPGTEAGSGSSGAGRLVIPAVIIALAVIGYGGWRGYKYLRDKKRGYK